MIKLIGIALIGVSFHATSTIAIGSIVGFKNIDFFTLFTLSITWSRRLQGLNLYNTLKYVMDGGNFFIITKRCIQGQKQMGWLNPGVCKLI